METYNIKTTQFEGPFDLLLFFIERDEIDINDIPIAQITQDFLEYIRHLESLNLDVASEFILVAATLMRIKAKMLIPRKEIDAAGNEIDPREELVQKLLEYKKFKSVIEEFSQLEDTRNFKFLRGNIETEWKSLADKALVDVELESLSLYKLFHTFHQLLSKFENRSNKPLPKIVTYQYSIEDQQSFILSKMKQKKKLNFIDLFTGLENRIHAVVTFLALLELLNLQNITILQGEGTNNFWLKNSKM